MKKIFDNLIVLDLANNHFGDLNHAKNIVNNFSKIIKKYNLNTTIKFQFRNLPNFIHKDFLNSNLHYVRRFLDTKLSDKDFEIIFKLIKKNKIKTSCTPFDEESVEKIEKMNFDYIKIASACALDFNLHERVIKNNIPKIISTGGVKINDIDKIVSFYSKKSQKFALMHCVSIYPTDLKKLNLNFIENLKKRYDDVPIGWSTHESPDEFFPAVLAKCKGASILERHIGIMSKKYKLNKYSMTPDLFEKWILNLNKSYEILGKYEKDIFPNETSTIEELSRGVYLKKNVKKNTILNKKNTYFAFPKINGQLSSHELKSNTKLKFSLKQDQPILKKNVEFDKNLQKEYKIKSYLHKAKALLNYGNIKVGEKFDMEISHHKGIDNFEKIGCFLFNIINKEYAKKIIVMLPNQKHPSHSHKVKAESFIVLFGTLTLIDNKKKYFLTKGDKVDLQKSGLHSFVAGREGCIFEEISTTALNTDSFYKDKKINSLPKDVRKTYVNNWFGIKGKTKF